MNRNWILSVLVQQVFFSSFLVLSSPAAGGGQFAKFNLESSSAERGVWWTTDNGEDSFARSSSSNAFDSFMRLPSSSNFDFLDGNDDDDDEETSSGRLFNRDSLNLVQFTNKSITCNDGTPAGYYIRRSPFKNNNIWIVFLEGGWFCFNEQSCQNRWMRLKNLMSSSDWPRHKQIGGILSSDPTENPYWWNANHIFVPYCSSDSWSGTVSMKDSNSAFSFMGALIVDEVVNNLVIVEKFGIDSTLILAGSSAGGTGVMINLDRVENLLRTHFGYSERRRGRVKGISDSGWFIDKVPFMEKNECQDVILCPPKISLRKGMNLWRARLPDSCQNTYPDEPWSCFFGYKLYPTLKAQLFVFQWLFDEAQMLVSNVPTPALRKEEWDFVYKVGDELKKSLVNVTSVMIPSCISHTVLLNRDWRRVEVNSVYLPRALKCWESDGIFEESNDIPASHMSHHRMFMEEESNPRHDQLYRNEYSRHRGRHTGNSFGELDDIFTNYSSKKKRRRHNRHRNNNGTGRRRRMRRKKKLEGQLLLLQEDEDSGKIDSTNNNNSNSSKRRRNNKKKRNNSNNNSNLNDSPYLHTNSRRRHSRRNSQNHNSSSSNNLRNSSTSANVNKSDRDSNRLKKRRRQRRWFSLCDGNNSSGDMRLIEKCSWPQCNKSCPKLVNPITGEEVDFKDLLRSFGLDLKLMANALGIDIATLNSMDHQVLLQMLTQHA